MDEERLKLRMNARAVAMALVAIVTVGFIFSLVLLNYTSARRVRAALTLQVARETEKRAMALEYFFSERRNNLSEISRSRELRVYFENQALGMSLNYGLRQSLPPIRELLEYYLEHVRIGSEPIFSRFVVLESDGTLLIDTANPEASIVPDSPLRVCLMPEHRQGQVLVRGEGWEVVVSQAHYFKDAYAGQILAWLHGAPVHAHLLGERSGRLNYVLLEAGGLDRPIGWLGSWGVPLPPAEDLARATLLEFDGGPDRTEYLAVRSRVHGTPFELLHVVPTLETLGQLKPWHNLIGMGLLAVLLLGGAGYSVRLYLKSRILSVHLAEVVARERLVSEKNLELQREIVERIKAQESLQILRMGWEEVPLERLLGQTLDGLMEIDWLGCRGEGAVHLPDGAGARVIAAARRGPHHDCGPCSASESPENWARWALDHQGEAVFVREGTSEHPSHCPLIGAHGHFWVPLTAGHQWIGLLCLVTRGEYVPHENARRFLTAFADVLSFMIQRRKADEELRIAHQANKTLIHAIPLMLITLDDKGRILRFNPAAEELFGRAAIDLVGRPIAGCGLPWSFETLPELLEATASAPGATTTREIRFTRRDGSEGFLSVVVGAMADSGPGAASKTLLVASDVTEQRKLEAQLLLTRKLEAIGQLAAGIAHEINTPSQYIRTNLQYLADAWAGLFAYVDEVAAVASNGLAPEHANRLAQAAEAHDLDFARKDVPKALHEATEGVARISEIVLAMKEFSRGSTPEAGMVELNRALTSCVTVARNRWKDSCEVQTNYDGTLPPIRGYPVEINQAFLNLIINAVQAVEESGARGRITITTRHLGDNAEVRIQDTGGGIPEAIRDRVFDPFFTTRPVGQGAGQGLTVARGIIVDRHGGEITLETEPGQGTTFIVRLPVG